MSEKIVNSILGVNRKQKIIAYIVRLIGFLLLKFVIDVILAI